MLEIFKPMVIFKIKINKTIFLVRDEIDWNLYKWSDLLDNWCSECEIENLEDVEKKLKSRAKERSL